MLQIIQVCSRAKFGQSSRYKEQSLQEAFRQPESEVFNHFLSTCVCCGHWTLADAHNESKLT